MNKDEFFKQQFGVSDDVLRLTEDAERSAAEQFKHGAAQQP